MMMDMDIDLVVATGFTRKMTFLDLPSDIIYNIAAYLLCSPPPSLSASSPSPSSSFPRTPASSLHAPSSSSPSSTPSLPLGPPTYLSTLLLTHSRLYSLLSPIHNPNLWIWRDAYCARFDESAALRRCAASASGHGATRMPAARWLNQLQNNCRALRFFRKGNVSDDRVSESWPSPLILVPPPTSAPGFEPPLPLLPPLPNANANGAQPPPQLTPVDHLALAPREDAEEATMDEALKLALIMALEDDGKNARQMIEYGHVRKWCLEAMEARWVEEHLRRRGPLDTDQGWVKENWRNSLVVTVFWMLCDQDTLISLPEKTLKHIYDLLSPVVHNPYRYPAAEYPPQRFRLPVPSPSSTALALPSSITTTHGAYPPLPPTPEIRQQTIYHYDAETLISFPLLSIPAKLLYFAISELTQPMKKLSEYPKDRRAWINKQNKREYTTSEGGWEMTGEQYLREWRRRGEKYQTMEDVDELNWGWVARPPVGRELTALSVLPSPEPMSSSPTKFGTGTFSYADDDDQEEENVLSFSKTRAYSNDIDTSILPRWRRKAAFPLCRSYISKSLFYDAEYWRLRLCSYGADPRRSSIDLDDPMRGIGKGNIKVRPGRVYDIGSMAGCWVGRMTWPNEESLRGTLGASSLEHTLNYTTLPVLDPFTGEPVVDPITGEPVLQERVLEGVETTPKIDVPYMPVVMRLWEGHLLTSMLNDLPSSMSTNTSTTTPSGNSAGEEDDDPFWSTIDPSTNPSSGDNMLNAWLPGFPGTTKVTLASGENNGEEGQEEVEFETEGWDGRKNRVRCRVWNGGEQELLGNDSLSLRPHDEQGSPAVNTAPYAVAESTSTSIEASCFVHRIPVNGNAATVKEGVWTGHGYTHVASTAITSAHTSTSSAPAQRECKECIARLKVENHLTRQHLREQKRRAKEERRRERWEAKKKAWNERMEGLREAREAKEREEEENQVDRLFASVGLGLGATNTNEHEDDVDDDDDGDEVSQECEESAYAVPSTVSSSSTSSSDSDDVRSESSFNSQEYTFEPVPNLGQDEDETDEDNDEENEDDEDEDEDAEEVEVEEHHQHHYHNHPDIVPSIPLSKLGTAYGGEVEVVPSNATAPPVSGPQWTKTATPSTSTRTIHSSTQGCSGIRSIVLFGTSGEERHGDAWGRFRYYGRVRDWDGLVGLVRVPVRGKGPRFSRTTNSASSTSPSANKASSSSTHPYTSFLSTHVDARTVLLNGDLIEEEDDGERGLVMFYGYISNGGESFVGSWRFVANGDVERPGWEGSFALGRRAD